MQEAAFLAGIAIDNCGTGVAHSIGHALGSLYHIPHGISVAVGLRAALEWNVAGRARGIRRRGDGDELRRRRDRRCLRHACAPTSVLAAATCAVDVGMSVDEIALTMNAVENQPMLHNNARGGERRRSRMLAERTVDVWHGLRS